MAWTPYQLTIAVAMVVTGSINTLSTKWADTMKAENSAGEVVSFDHPYFQTEGMFIGEILCMVTFYLVRCCERQRRRRQEQVEMAPMNQDTNFPKYIFLVPALCDMVATSTMYMGLILTYASSFQMLRGAVIVFTGLLSMVFLGRRLRYYQWVGIFTVITGLIIVGLSDFLGSSDANGYSVHKIIIGDLLIVAAQVVTATQMVIEEKFVVKHDVPPLLAVGWEGVFGFTFMGLLLVPFYWIPAGIFSGNPRGVLEDVGDAVTQISNYPLLLLPILGNIISIAFFNFAGVSVTKELSATTRMVLDSVRTFVVWIVSLLAFGQKFQWLQPLGFGVLLLGLMLYNDLVLLPLLRRHGWLRDTPAQDTQPILPSASSTRSLEGEEKESVGDPDAPVEPM